MKTENHKERMRIRRKKYRILQQMFIEFWKRRRRHFDGKGRPQGVVLNRAVIKEIDEKARAS